MSTDYQNSILWRGEDPLKKKFKPSYDHTVKTTRYFPGKAPAWAREEEKKKEEEEAKKKAEAPVKSRRRDRLAAAVVVEDKVASRLRRLQEAASASSDTGAERQLRHRVVHDAQVLEDTVDRGDFDISSIAGGIADKLMAKLDKKDDFKGVEDVKHLKAEAEDEEDDEDLDIERPAEVKTEVKPEVKTEMKDEDGDDEDRVADMRQRARARALSQRKQEEDQLLKQEEEEKQDEDVEESEYETESEADDPRKSAMLKPVFVSKKGRDTVREKEAMEKEEEEKEERKLEKVKERKVESKSLVIDVIQKEADEDAAKALGLDDTSDVELIDDNDEINEAEEYEMWKIRELKRMQRDAKEKVTKEKELEFIEKRRGMTDEERAADDARLDAGHLTRDEAKGFNFLQKYYHRGTFFQDKAETGEEPLYNRDYHEPTAEETFDKSALPKVMQVRRGMFGKKGQVKHTHLTDVDTTDMSAAWSQQNKQVQKYQERMAGAGGVNNFVRPGSSGSRQE